MTQHSSPQDQAQIPLFDLEGKSLYIEAPDFKGAASLEPAELAAWTLPQFPHLYRLEPHH